MAHRTQYIHLLYVKLTIVPQESTQTVRNTLRYITYELNLLILDVLSYIRYDRGYFIANDIGVYNSSW